jgi:hypothetical protein
MLTPDHPYQRPNQPYPPTYHDRPGYTPEMMSPYSHGGPPYNPSHAPEYMPQNYGKQPPSQTGEYYYPDNRGAPPPTGAQFPNYPERRPKSYETQPQGRPYPPENPYPHYPTERKPSYVPDQRPPPQYYQQQQPAPPQRGYYQEPPPERTLEPQHGQPTYQPERRESRHSINALLSSEEGRKPSPFSDSIARAGSDTASSMGRSTPLATRPEDQEMEDPNVKLPPLRNGSKFEEQPAQGRSNSNLWKLVSVATDEQ